MANSTKLKSRVHAHKSEKLALIPSYILFPLWVISLTLPNLIYSGVKFYDTLHIIKWTVTGVPIALAFITAGVRLVIYGRERFEIKIDKFAIIWALMIAYSVVQPLWVNISSPDGFLIETVCLIAVFGFYILSVISFPGKCLRPILYLASINAAVNCLFAELQIRKLSSLKFLTGTVFEWLKDYSSIILPTPGYYIGNTAQQNMFGLWLAICTLGMAYIYIFDLWVNNGSERGKKIWLPLINVALIVISMKFIFTVEDFGTSLIFIALTGILFIILMFMSWKLKIFLVSVCLLLMSVNFWGLIGSTSRSGVISLIVGLLTMIIFIIRKFGRFYALRFFAVILILSSVFWASTFSMRSKQIVEKTVDIVQHAENIGNRRGIWATSYEILKLHPEGVGTGQYKWHYLEGQREGFKDFKVDWYGWQYTHWAHNEFLQWFCEGGIIGGIILIIMYLIWFMPALLSLFKNDSVPINSIWGCSLVSLISFAAFFTRPFHRIENMVWIALAFALSNNGFKVKSYNFVKSDFISRLTGILCVLGSVLGIIYISGGIYGNYLLRQALSTNNARVQNYYLNEADKYSIVHEEVQRNKGLHFMQIGENQNDDDITVKGFNILWESFKREPHSEDITRIINFAQRFQDEEILREIVSYFHPDAWHLERQPRRAEDGTIINALVVVNGPAENSNKNESE